MLPGNAAESSYSEKEQPIDTQPPKGDGGGTQLDAAQKGKLDRHARTNECEQRVLPLRAESAASASRESCQCEQRVLPASGSTQEDSWTEGVLGIFVD